MNFLDNIAVWFEQNKLTIITVFTFLQTSGIGAMLVAWFKNRHTNKITNDSFNKVNTELDTVKQENEVLMYKLNCMLEVFSLVYTNIKNEDTRRIVQNKLADAKNYATEQKTKIVEQLTELKNTANNILNDNVAALNDAIDKAKIIASVDDTIER